MVLRRLAVVSLLIPSLAAQDAPWFEPTRPMFYIKVLDLPGLCAAVEQSALGRFLAEPDVAEAFELGKGRYLELVRRWTEVAEFALELEGHRASLSTLAELGVRAADWHDVHSFELSASIPPTQEVEDPENALPFRFFEPWTVLSLRATEAGWKPLSGRFREFETRLRKHLGSEMDFREDQKVLGLPGTTFVPKDGEEEKVVLVPEQVTSPPTTNGLWLVRRDGLIAGGYGQPERIGRLAPFPDAPPSFSLGLNLADYVTLMTGLMVVGMAADENPIRPVLEALGLDKAGLLEWRLHVEDGLVQDDLSLELGDRPGGILGALLRGMAPLPDQPLPDGGMLQVRCTFDVDLLAQSIDQLLTIGEQPTLQEQGLIEDIRRAWTGGAAFAIGRPAPGSLVPRLFASFGIVDEAALGRLLEQLNAAVWLEAEPRRLADHDCTLLSIEDFPAAVQPSYSLVDGTLHFAESAGSLRAMLKAKAAGAPRALDVGDAPRPGGEGRMMPNFELRFDGAAIHAAIQEAWMRPAALALSMGEDVEPFVALDEMPDIETVTRHLGRGRGALRRSNGRVTLSMAGTLGGPETLALASTFGPMLSLTYAQSWRYTIDSLRTEATRAQLPLVYEAICAFEKREGRKPKTLGELLAAGDLKESRMLAIPGAKGNVPVMHEGKQLATTSYRYYPGGLPVSPTGTEVTALLIAIEPSMWQRMIIDEEGDIQEGWGEFADDSLDEIERKARERGRNQAAPSSR